MVPRIDHISYVVLLRTYETHRDVKMTDRNRSSQVMKVDDLCNIPEKKLKVSFQDELNGNFRVQNAKPASKGYLNISKATLFRWIKEGKFPKPTRLSPKLVVWSKFEIDEWLEKNNLKISK